MREETPGRVTGDGDNRDKSSRGDAHSTGSRYGPDGGERAGGKDGRQSMSGRDKGPGQGQGPGRGDRSQMYGPGGNEMQGNNFPANQHWGDGNNGPPGFNGQGAMIGRGGSSGGVGESREGFPDMAGLGHDMNVWGPGPGSGPGMSAGMGVMGGLGMMPPGRPGGWDGRDNQGMRERGGSGSGSHPDGFNDWQQQQQQQQQPPFPFQMGGMGPRPGGPHGGQLGGPNIDPTTFNGAKDGSHPHSNFDHFNAPQPFGDFNNNPWGWDRGPNPQNVINPIFSVCYISISSEFLTLQLIEFPTFTTLCYS